MARLDRQAVLEEGLALADAGGVDAVTLRRVAQLLDVTPMALYRHVAGKDDLLDGMADLLYAELVVEEREDWWEELAALARETRRVLREHPSAPQLLARPLAGAHSHALARALRAALRRGGFRGREATELHDQLSALVVALARSSPSDAAFERGLALLGAGLHARRSDRGSPGKGPGTEARTRRERKSR